LRELESKIDAEGMPLTTLITELASELQEVRQIKCKVVSLLKHPLTKKMLDTFGKSLKYSEKPSEAPSKWAQLTFLPTLEMITEAFTKATSHIGNLEERVAGVEKKKGDNSEQISAASTAPRVSSEDNEVRHVIVPASQRQLQTPSKLGMKSSEVIVTKQLSMMKVRCLLLKY